VERGRNDVSHFVTNFIDSGGLYAVLFLMLIESCGVPFPSEVIMPFAGWMAASGHLTFAAAVVAGAVGNLVGSLIAYALAAWLGEPVLLGPGKYIGIRKSHVEHADRWFQKYGLAAVFFGRMLPVIRTYISFPAGLARVKVVPLAAVFFGRMLPVIRTYISFPAGLARVKVVPFSVLTFVGALPWCAALAVAGYELGGNWEKVSGPIEKIAILIAVLVAIWGVVWFVRTRRSADSA
jgi:membrane protein DedA with SNARE-associated domain